jgi:hypothetical protein
MAYDAADRDSVAVEEGGGHTGLIVGVIIALVVLALIGSFLASGLFGTGAPGSGGNNGGDGPLPTRNNPAAS